MRREPNVLEPELDVARRKRGVAELDAARREPDVMYEALRSRDRRFDGEFFVAVTSTGVYCRPSCPAITPKRENVRFYPTAAAAQNAGFRACLRCQPHAAPGSAEWNRRGDLAARAVGLIADGVADREGVAGLARRLAYSERHLHRQLRAELGAGPLALARAQRAQSARMLIQTTRLALIDVAHAAGFASVRQFNDTVKTTYGRTPTELRRRSADAHGDGSGALSVHLAYRDPLDWSDMLAFLAPRAVAGVEEVSGDSYRRTLRLPHGWGVAQLSRRDERWIECALTLADLRDLGAAVGRCRRLLDLDCDPAAPDAHLAEDPLLAPLVRRRPGLRVAGTVDGAELAIRAVLGQQVSVAAARTTAGRLTRALGEPLPSPIGSLTHLFPTPHAIAAAGSSTLSGPARRRRTLQALAAALALGEVVIDPGSDRAEARAALLAIPGIGPWTVEYIAMRALADPDAFLPTDLGVVRAIARLGQPARPSEVAAMSERWRPWRAYALQHLWAAGPR
ncbi:MAG TPA: AlkA N-terminal domain-containing protein [Solirubrobacteraceae bacterium]|nr:AlkA N-terminal domain-containing protein [Solirubrobacteraceae bacterium]